MDKASEAIFSLQPVTFRYKKALDPEALPQFERAIAKQQKQIETLTAGLQKVSVQLELSKPAPQTVLNND